MDPLISGASASAGSLYSDFRSFISVENWTILLLRDLRALNQPNFDELLAVCEKYSEQVQYGHGETKNLKSLYLELGARVNAIEKSHYVDPSDAEFLWRKSFAQLTKMLRFSANVDLWREIAFSLVEEDGYDFHGSNDYGSSVLSLLIHLKSASALNHDFEEKEGSQEDEIEKGKRDFHFIKKIYFNKGIEVLIDYLSYSGNKQKALTKIFAHLQEMPSQKISDESHLRSIFEVFKDSDISIDLLIKVLERSMVGQQSKHMLIDVFVEKCSSLKKQHYAHIVQLVDLAAREQQSFWEAIQGKMVLVLEADIQYANHAESLFDFTTWERWQRLRAYWEYQACAEDLSKEGCFFFLQYDFMLFSELFSNMSSEEAEQALEFFNKKEVGPIFEQYPSLKPLIEKSMVDISLRLHYPEIFGEVAVPKWELISFIKGEFATDSFSVDFVGRLFSSYIQSISRKEEGIFIFDLYQLVTAIFTPKTFKDRRDLVFYALAAQYSSDECSDLLEVCPLPDSYEPPIMEKALFTSILNGFKHSESSLKEKIQFSELLLKYYHLEDSQMQTYIFEACVYVNSLAHLTFEEFSLFLDLHESCLERFDQVEWNDEQVLQIVDALTPPLLIVDFRDVYYASKKDPMEKYVDPTLRKLKRLVEKYKIEDYGIIEHHYFYWNISAVENIEKILPQSLMAQALRESGRRFIKKVHRLPFNHLKVEIAQVGNGCMKKLEASSLYDRCQEISIQKRKAGPRFYFS